jgi:hypothetical protein
MWNTAAGLASMLQCFDFAKKNWYNITVRKKQSKKFLVEPIGWATVIKRSLTFLMYLWKA